MNALLEHADASAPRASALDMARLAAVGAAIVIGSVVFSFKFTSFLHAKEFVIYLFLSVFAAATFIRGRIRIDGLTDFIPLWLFLAACLLNLLLGHVKVPADAIAELLRWLATGSCCVLLYDVAGSQRWREHLRRALLTSTVIVGILGIIQYFGLAPSVFPVFPQYTQRVYSVFGNQDLFGGYVAFGIPLALHLRHKVRWPMLFILAFATLLSASRSSWLAAAAGFAAYLLLNRVSLRKSAVPAAIMAAAIAVTVAIAPVATIDRARNTFGDSDEGYNARIACWRAGWDIFSQSPLLGVGLGNYAYYSPEVLGRQSAFERQSAPVDLERHADHPHSEPVRILAETGLFGLFCWMWMAWRLCRRSGPELAPLVALGVFALFNGALLSIPHLLAAMTLTVLSLSRREHAAESAAAARVIPLATILSAGFLIWAVITPSLYLQAAQDAHAQGRPALELYRRAAEFPWPSAEARKEYGVALAADGQDASARRELAASLKGLDTGDVFLALATISARQGDLQGARQFALQCELRWPKNEDVKKLVSTLEQAPIKAPRGASAVR